MLRGIIATLVLAFSGTALGQDFLKRVDCTFPKTWVKSYSSRDAHRLERVYSIDTLMNASDTLTVDAFLRISDAPSPPLDSVALLLPLQRPNTSVVCDCPDGPSWRTLIVLEAYKEGKRRLALLRVGLKNGVRADFSINFPIQPADDNRLRPGTRNNLSVTPGGPSCQNILVQQAKLAYYVHDFNTVCRSLRIDALEPVNAAIAVSGENEK